MAVINRLGNVVAICGNCGGSKSTFEYMNQSRAYGAIKRTIGVSRPGSLIEDDVEMQYRLFRCAGCGSGAVGVIVMDHVSGKYPDDINRLFKFMPEVAGRLSLPNDVPRGIKAEFMEGELCLDAGALRAAAGMFRSVLDKTMRANGYKTGKKSLAVQIDDAAADGLITASRQRRAHRDVRVLGNDVLHDEWHEIPADDVLAARHYTQRVLEDFYDDRESVLVSLRFLKRIPDEDKDGDD